MQSRLVRGGLAKSCLNKAPFAANIGHIGKNGNAGESWERGTNEDMNGLIRQYFPKDRDCTTITDEQLQQVQDKLNNRPRKIPDMKTPNELLIVISPNVALGY